MNTSTVNTTVPQSTLVEIQAAVIEIAATTLGLAPATLGPETTFTDLAGFESIKVLRIISKLERRYDIELADDIVFGVQRPRELAEAIHGLIAGKAS